MLNTQLIYNGLSSSYSSVSSATRSTAESITEVFTNTQLLPIIAIITTIASVLFGAYKLAMHLGYFSPSENESIAPSAPPLEEDNFEYEPVTPSAPSIEEIFQESAPETQESLFARFYPQFGNSS